MAFSEVGAGTQRAQGTFDNLSTPGNVAFPGNVVSGSLLVVGGATWKADVAEVPVITDTLGTSYTVVNVLFGTNFRIFIARGLAPSSGANTVSVDHTAAHYFSYSIDEFSGPHATPLDVDGGSSTGTSTTPQDDILTVAADDLIIGVMGFSNFSNVTLAPGGSYTQIGEEEDNLNHVAHNMVFRIVTTPTTYTVDWTTGSSVSWIAQTMAFKPTVAAGGLKGNLSLLGVGQ